MGAAAKRTFQLAVARSCFSAARDRASLMLLSLAFSTLYPNAAQANLGVFVENALRQLEADGRVKTQVVAPLGLPPFPLSLLKPYAPLRSLPSQETRHGLLVDRPRYPVVPSIGWRFNPALLHRLMLPRLQRLRETSFRFDVIDAQFFFPCGIAAVRIGRALGAPVTIKARGADITYWAQNPIIRPWALAAANLAAGLTAVSDDLKTEMVRLGMPADKIEVHRTGVDLETFRPMDRAAARAELGVLGPMMLSIGALIERKGHDLVLAALARAPQLSYWIAGHGPLEADLKRLAESLGVADRVRFLGSVPHADLPRLINAADLTALGTKREGLANAWVESLACGVPVVTTRAEGAGDALDRPACGRIVESRSPEAFAAAIEEVLSAPPAPEAVRASAERFSWARHVNDKVAHLTRLAAGFSHVTENPPPLGEGDRSA
jgi:teichuronic acid biosynthesis glycosyltransferase TuaC